ncbi:MAG: hypothetical protein AB1782_02060 [Cyanobacteriota bacterium]
MSFQVNNYYSQAYAYAGNGEAFAYASTGNIFNQQDQYQLPYQLPQPQPQPQQLDFMALLLGLDMAINCQNNASYTNLNNIVAANEVGTITGDPHFKGGDGGRYDVQGQAGKVYDLLSDSNLSFNGRFDAWGSNGATIVGETAINVSSLGGNSYSTVTYSKDGVAKVNGQELKDGETVVLADGGTATKQGNKLIVQTAEGYTITQTCHPSAHGNYINSEVKTGALGVATDNVLPGGLLGQTFDADNVARNGAKGAGAQGEGAIDGVVQDYETALGAIGDVQLDANGNEIKPYDPFTDIVNWLSGLLNPDPNKDFIQVMTFVMNAIFALLGVGNYGNQNQQQY